MRMIYLAFLMLFLCKISINAQTTLTLTFTAQYDTAHAALDSVFVQNLSNGSDTTLYVGDTTLVLTTVTASGNEMNNDFYVSANFPNPFTEKTAIVVNLPKQETISLTLYDLLGKRLASYSNTYAMGQHTFDIGAGNANVLLLLVEAGAKREVVKMLQFGSTQQVQNTISYQGATSGMVFTPKSSKSVFDWLPDDTLRFFGFTTIDTIGIGNDIIDHVPTQNETFTFNIVHGMPCMDEPFVYDGDGNVYRTVLIGTQCWISGNLRTTTYNDGTPIFYAPAVDIWDTLTGPAYCWFDNDSAQYAEIYGALYNFFAVDTSKTDGRNICPEGWHVPTDDEWKEMEMYLGMTQTDADNSGWRGTIEGNMLKQKGTNYWDAANNGNNKTGFDAIGNGYRHNNGTYDFMGARGYWWASGSGAWRRNLYNNRDNIGRYGSNPRDGYSVRCIK